jgi:hypothetical protein
MATPMTSDHPETLEGEIYLGNFTPHEAARIAWRTKHSGCWAYCADGTPYPDQEVSSVKPYFAERAEIEQNTK